MKVHHSNALCHALEILWHMIRIGLYSKVDSLHIIKHKWKRVKLWKDCNDDGNIFTAITTTFTFLKLSETALLISQISSKVIALQAKYEHNDCDLHGNLRWDASDFHQACVNSASVNAGNLVNRPGKRLTGNDWLLVATKVHYHETISDNDWTSPI